MRDVDAGILNRLFQAPAPDGPIIGTESVVGA